MTSGTHCVNDYGARANSHELATAAFQAAIDAAAQAGGGVVYVPVGRYMIGTIFLKSHVTLELQAGALVAGSPDLKDYVCRNYPGLWPHDEQTEFYHLIVADHAVDVTLRGPGRIDGNGPAFRRPGNGPRDWMPWIKPRVESMLHFRNCQNVRVLDVRLQDSPAWNLHLYDCDNVWIRGLQIDGALFGPNIDGIDVQGCRDVMISDCQICTGDDGIVCFPSLDRDCERVVATNCSIQTNCVAFKAYVVDGRAVRDLAFSNCTVTKSTRAVSLYMFNHGLIENVVASNLTIDTESGFWLNRPLQLDARGRDARYIPVPDTAPRGTIRNVQFSNTVIKTDGRITMSAADDLRIENVVLRDIRMRYPVVEDPKAHGNVRSTQFHLHSPDVRAARAAVVAENVSELLVHNLQVSWPDAEHPDRWQGLLNPDGAPKPYPTLPEDPAFSVLWGRRLNRVDLENPFAQPQPGAVRYDLADCTAVRSDERG
jgi:polygalacturonase